VRIHHKDRPVNAVYCENHMEHINTLCGQNAEYLNVHILLCFEGLTTIAYNTAIQTSASELRSNKQDTRQYSRLLIGKYSVRISAGIPVILTEALRGFPQSLQVKVGIVLRLGHDRYLPNPFQFIFIHLSS
jgi:hypothetical protein